MRVQWQWTALAKKFLDWWRLWACLHHQTISHAKRTLRTFCFLFNARSLVLRYGPRLRRENLLQTDTRTVCTTSSEIKIVLLLTDNIVTSSFDCSLLIHTQTISRWRNLEILRCTWHVKNNKINCHKCVPKYDLRLRNKSSEKDPLSLSRKAG